MLLEIQTQTKNYQILLKHNSLSQLQEYINLHRTILIITDTNIPNHWIQQIQMQCKQAYVFKIEPNETSKNYSTYLSIIEYMLSIHMQRKDCIIALGGGVVGDISGFVAASYMRGIDYIQIPTTTLSQIDSSIGGKVALNINQTKNVIGFFYPPTFVCIDPIVLTTLSKRHISNGLVEAIKVGLLKDSTILNYLKNKDWMNSIQDIIYLALQVKKQIVEADEKEQNIRKLLNFGHTVGHAIESYYQFTQYLHGECVALGMLLFMDSKKQRQQVLTIYQNLEIQLPPLPDAKDLLPYIKNDKKAQKDTITTIQIDQNHNVHMIDCTLLEIQKRIEEYTL